MAYNQSIIELGHPAITLAEYTTQTREIPACIALITQCQTDTTVCARAEQTCNNAQFAPYENTGLDPYDISKQCGPNPLCGDYTALTNFLNLASTKTALSVPASITWEACSNTVNGMFSSDWMKRSVCCV